MIAKLLVRECAVVTAQEQALPDGLPSEFLVDLSRNIYAQSRDFDGVYYIESLRNSKSEEAAENEVLLLRPQEAGAIHAVLIAEDHVGVRAVHFASSSRVPQTSLGPGVWWKSISRRGGIAKIRATTDVSKATGSSSQTS